MKKTKNHRHFNRDPKTNLIGSKVTSSEEGEGPKVNVFRPDELPQLVSSEDVILPPEVNEEPKEEIDIPLPIIKVKSDIDELYTFLEPMAKILNVPTIDLLNLSLSEIFERIREKRSFEFEESNRILTSVAANEFRLDGDPENEETDLKIMNAFLTNGFENLADQAKSSTNVLNILRAAKDAVTQFDYLEGRDSELHGDRANEAAIWRAMKSLVHPRCVANVIINAEEAFRATLGSIILSDLETKDIDIDVGKRIVQDYRKSFITLQMQHFFNLDTMGGIFFGDTFKRPAMEILFRDEFTGLMKRSMDNIFALNMMETSNDSLKNMRDIYHSIVFGGDPDEKVSFPELYKAISLKRIKKIKDFYFSTMSFGWTPYYNENGGDDGITVSKMLPMARLTHRLMIFCITIRKQMFDSLMIRFGMSENSVEPQVKRDNEDKVVIEKKIGVLYGPNKQKNENKPDSVFPLDNAEFLNAINLEIDDARNFTEDKWSQLKDIFLDFIEEEYAPRMDLKDPKSNLNNRPKNIERYRRMKDNFNKIWVIIRENNRLLLSLQNLIANKTLDVDMAAMKRDFAMYQNRYNGLTDVVSYGYNIFTTFITNSLNKQIRSKYFGPYAYFPQPAPIMPPPFPDDLDTMCSIIHVLTVFGQLSYSQFETQPSIRRNIEDARKKMEGALQEYQKNSADFMERVSINQNLLSRDQREVIEAGQKLDQEFKKTVKEINEFETTRRGYTVSDDRRKAIGDVPMETDSIPTQLFSEIELKIPEELAFGMYKSTRTEEIASSLSREELFDAIGTVVLEQERNQLNRLEVLAERHGFSKHGNLVGEDIATKYNAETCIPPDPRLNAVQYINGNDALKRVTGTDAERDTGPKKINVPGYRDMNDPVYKEWLNDKANFEGIILREEEIQCHLSSNIANRYIKNGKFNGDRLKMDGVLIHTLSVADNTLVNQSSEPTMGVENPYSIERSLMGIRKHIAIIIESQYMTKDYKIQSSNLSAWQVKYPELRDKNLKAAKLSFDEHLFYWMVDLLNLPNMYDKMIELKRETNIIDKAIGITIMRKNMIKMTELIKEANAHFNRKAEETVNIMLEGTSRINPRTWSQEYLKAYEEAYEKLFKEISPDFKNALNLADFKELKAEDIKTLEDYLSHMKTLFIKKTDNNNTTTTGDNDAPNKRNVDLSHETIMEIIRKSAEANTNVDDMTKLLAAEFKSMGVNEEYMQGFTMHWVPKMMGYIKAEEDAQTFLEASIAYLKGTKPSPQSNKELENDLNFLERNAKLQRNYLSGLDYRPEGEEVPNIPKAKASLVEAGKVTNERILLIKDFNDKIIKHAGERLLLEKMIADDLITIRNYVNEGSRTQAASIDITDSFYKKEVAITMQVEYLDLAVGKVLEASNSLVLKTDNMMNITGLGTYGLNMFSSFFSYINIFGEGHVVREWFNSFFGWSNEIKPNPNPTTEEKDAGVPMDDAAWASFNSTMMLSYVTNILRGVSTFNKHLEILFSVSTSTFGMISRVTQMLDLVSKVGGWMPWFKSDFSTSFSGSGMMQFAKIMGDVGQFGFTGTSNATGLGWWSLVGGSCGFAAQILTETVGTLMTTYRDVNKYIVWYKDSANEATMNEAKNFLIDNAQVIHGHLKEKFDHLSYNFWRTVDLSKNSPRKEHVASLGPIKSNKMQTKYNALGVYDKITIKVAQDILSLQPFIYTSLLDIMVEKTSKDDLINTIRNINNNNDYETSFGRRIYGAMRLISEEKEMEEPNRSSPTTEDLRTAISQFRAMRDDEINRVFILGEWNRLENSKTNILDELDEKMGIILNDLSKLSLIGYNGNNPYPEGQGLYLLKGTNPLGERIYYNKFDELLQCELFLRSILLYQDWFGFTQNKLLNFYRIQTDPREEILIEPLGGASNPTKLLGIFAVNWDLILDNVLQAWMVETIYKPIEKWLEEVHLIYWKDPGIINLNIKAEDRVIAQDILTAQRRIISAAKMTFYSRLTQFYDLIVYNLSAYNQFRAGEDRPETTISENGRILSSIIRDDYRTIRRIMHRIIEEMNSIIVTNEIQVQMIHQSQFEDLKRHISALDTFDNGTGQAQTINIPDYSVAKVYEYKVSFEKLLAKCGSSLIDLELIFKTRHKNLNVHKTFLKLRNAAIDSWKANYKIVKSPDGARVEDILRGEKEYINIRLDVSFRNWLTESNDQNYVHMAEDILNDAYVRKLYLIDPTRDIFNQLHAPYKPYGGEITDQFEMWRMILLGDPTVYAKLPGPFSKILFIIWQGVKIYLMTQFGFLSMAATDIIAFMVGKLFAYGTIQFFKWFFERIILKEVGLTEELQVENIICYETFLQSITKYYGQWKRGTLDLKNDDPTNNDISKMIRKEDFQELTRATLSSIRKYKIYLLLIRGLFMPFLNDTLVPMIEGYAPVQEAARAITREVANKTIIPLTGLKSGKEITDPMIIADKEEELLKRKRSIQTKPPEVLTKNDMGALFASDEMAAIFARQSTVNYGASRIRANVGDINTLNLIIELGRDKWKQDNPEWEGLGGSIDDETMNIIMNWGKSRCAYWANDTLSKNLMNSILNLEEMKQLDIKGNNIDNNNIVPVIWEMVKRNTSAALDKRKLVPDTMDYRCIEMINKMARDQSKREVGNAPILVKRRRPRPIKRPRPEDEESEIPLKWARTYDPREDLTPQQREHILSVEAEEAEAMWFLLGTVNVQTPTDTFLEILGLSNDILNIDFISAEVTKLIGSMGYFAKYIAKDGFLFRQNSKIHHLIFSGILSTEMASIGENAIAAYSDTQYHTSIRKTIDYVLMKEGSEFTAIPDNIQPNGLSKLDYFFLIRIVIKAIRNLWSVIDGVIGVNSEKILPALMLGEEIISHIHFVLNFLPMSVDNIFHQNYFSQPNGSDNSLFEKLRIRILNENNSSRSSLLPEINGLILDVSGNVPIDNLVGYRHVFSLLQEDAEKFKSQQANELFSGHKILFVRTPVTKARDLRIFFVSLEAYFYCIYLWFYHLIPNPNLPQVAIQSKLKSAPKKLATMNK